MSESDREWYSGGDLRGSSGDNLCSGDTAVTDSAGGLGGNTIGQCSGGTAVMGSLGSPVSGTGGVQRMGSGDDSASTGGVQMERNDGGTGGVHRMRDDEGMSVGWQQQVITQQQQQIAW